MLASPDKQVGMRADLNFNFEWIEAAKGKLNALNEFLDELSENMKAKKNNENNIIILLI